jgi:mono/diheme cytochrome c family protein
MQVSRWLIPLAAGVCLIAVRAPVAADDAAAIRAEPEAATSRPGLSASDPTPDTASSAELVAQGRDLYAQLCSHCHGLRMVNPGNSSFDLRKFPHEDRARFVNSVTKGKNTMPAWGDMLKPEEIDALWAYVRTGGKS